MYINDFTLAFSLRQSADVDVDVETEYIAEKPTNRAFPVCRTEMLSSFRIRIGNISPSAT